MWLKCSLNFHCYQLLNSPFYSKQYFVAKFTLIHIKGGMCYKFR